MGRVENCDLVPGTSNGDIVAADSNGLRVFIVGGGIGGLTAAIALRQQGHEVEVGMAASDPMLY